VVQLFTWGFVTRPRLRIMCFVLGIILVPVALIEIAQGGYQAGTLPAKTFEA